MNICSLRSLWCSILRLISLSAPGERQRELLAYGAQQAFQNALVEVAYATDVALRCDKEQTYGAHTRKSSTRPREQKGARGRGGGVQVSTEGQRLNNLLL